MSDRVRRRPGGRSSRVRSAVFRAALDLLRTQGLDKLTVAEVAVRAGVHQASLYRRWSTRESLILDALLSTASEQLRVPDTGTLRGDLIAYTTELAAFLATPLGCALERTLASASDDPDTRQTRDQYWNSRRELTRQMITRAIDRGELPDTIDADLALEMILAPLQFKIVFAHEPLDLRLPERLVDMLLDGIRPRPSTQSLQALTP